MRPRRVERLALQLLDRFAADLAEEMPGARPRFQPGEGDFVCGSPRANKQAAAARGARRVERYRLRCPEHDDVRGDTAAEVELTLEQERPFRIRLRSREADELERLSVKVEQELTVLIPEDRPQLDEIGH